MLLSALQHIFAGMKRTRDQKLSSGLSYPSLLVEDKRACWLRSGFQHDSLLQQHDCVRWCHHLCLVLVGFEPTRILSATGVGIFDRGRERHVRIKIHVARQ